MIHVVKLASLFLLVPLCSFAANQGDMEKLLELNKTTPVTHLDLSNADLRTYSFHSDKIDLQGANLSHSNLSGVDLSKINLASADLSYSDLSNAKLYQTNLAAANLHHANLSNAQFQESNLTQANLSYANIEHANLQQAILVKANLTCANLNQADLTKSNFTDATISGATLINTLVAEVIGYEGGLTDSRVKC